MLKLIDNVDPKYLAEFGFKPKYDEDTGEITAWEKLLKEKAYEGLRISLETTKSKIRIFRRRGTKSWMINSYNNWFDIDTLFDLIQAGLVEKVDDK